MREVIEQLEQDIEVEREVRRLLFSVSKKLDTVTTELAHRQVQNDHLATLLEEIKQTRRPRQPINPQLQFNDIAAIKAAQERAEEAQAAYKARDRSGQLQREAEEIARRAQDDMMFEWSINTID